MTNHAWIQISFYFLALLILVKPLGLYMAKVYEGKDFGLNRVLGWLEKLIYRMGGVNPQSEMNWKTYALAMLLFNIVGGLILYALMRFQNLLPFNLAGQGAVA